MFSLILITILAGIRTCRGQAWPESVGSLSFGFGAAGGLGYNNGYGYGSRYGYYPQSYFSGGYGGYSHVYGPERLISYTPFTHSLSSIESPLIGSYSSSFRNTGLPQTYFYQDYQRCSYPNYPGLTPLAQLAAPVTQSIPTQVPVTQSIPYYNIPVFESVETYRIYSPSKESKQNQTQVGLNLESKTEIDAGNKTTNGSTNTVNNEDALKEDTTSETEPELQLTYLGFVPQPSFRSASESTMVDEAPQKIPFYILDYDDSPRSSAVGGKVGSPRSSSGSPTMYVSPTRLLPTSNGYPTMGFPGSVTSPIRSISPGISTQGFSSPNLISSGASIPLSPYRSAVQINPPLYRSTCPDDQPGFYIIDVEPVTRYNARLSNGPLLRTARPTIPPYIQTVTGPMGGPITGLLGPASRGLNSNTQSQSGIYNSGENLNKYETQSLNTGYQTQLPYGQAFSNFQLNSEVSAQKYDGRGEQGTSSGLGSLTFGSPGLSG